MAADDYISFEGNEFIIPDGLNTVYLQFNNDGTYELTMPIEEMLKHESGLIKALGACLRDVYEIGLRGGKIPEILKGPI